MNLSGKRAGLRSTRCWQVAEGLTDERRLDSQLHLQRLKQRIEGTDVTQVAAAARRMFAPEGRTSLSAIASAVAGGPLPDLSTSEHSRRMRVLRETRAGTAALMSALGRWMPGVRQTRTRFPLFCCCRVGL